MIAPTDLLGDFEYGIRNYTPYLQKSLFFFLLSLHVEFKSGLQIVSPSTLGVYLFYVI